MTVSIPILIIDTKLLVLFVVGITDPDLITRHKRLKDLSLEDFYLLCQVINSSLHILFTPNTLTETSNWLGYINEPAKGQLFNTFRILIQNTFMQNTSERYVKSRIASDAQEFPRLGLTDSALLEIAGNSGTIITTDLSLYLAALSRGLSVINFHHLREERLLR